MGMSITDEELEAMRERLRARREQRKFDDECRASIRLVRAHRGEEAAAETIYVDTAEPEIVDDLNGIGEDEVRLQRVIAWILMLMAFGVAVIILDWLRIAHI